MGNFYVNFTARGATQEAVAKSLRSAGRKAFVGRTLNGLTVFYEQASDTQDEAAITQVGAQVSKELDAPVLAVLNHDDDILCYWLFVAGKLLDNYNSCPGYFTDGETRPSGGDSRQLCAAFGVGAVAEEVEKVLRRQDYVFALERHEALAGLLHHPSSYVCLGYGYIDQGELPHDVSQEDLVRIE